MKFATDKESPFVIEDENLPDLLATIAKALVASGPTFEAFVAKFGLPKQAAPTVAGLLGRFYGQATEKDLFVLPSSTII